jgi:general stress protein 26
MATDADRIYDLVESIEFCMLISKRGQALRARPMRAIVDRDDGLISFLTDARAHKDEEVAAEPEVCLAFAKPNSNAYVSISGAARVTDDRALVKTYWDENAKTWFPDGPEDPHIRVLTVAPREAEFWDGTSNPIAVALEVARARLKDERPDLGDNRKVAMGAAR